MSLWSKISSLFSRTKCDVAQASPQDGVMRPLRPSDVMVGWPEMLASRVRPGIFHWSIQFPNGAIQANTYSPEHMGPTYIEELKKYLLAHSVSADLDAFDKVTEEVDRALKHRLRQRNIRS